MNSCLDSLDTFPVFLPKAIPPSLLASLRCSSSSIPTEIKSISLYISAIIVNLHPGRHQIPRNSLPFSRIPLILHISSSLSDPISEFLPPKKPFLFWGLNKDMDRISFCFVTIVVLVSGLLSTRVYAIQFDLQSGHTKCISEDIKSNSMTVGKYHIVNPSEGYPLPDTHKVTVRVTSAYGNNYHYSDHVQSGQFAFQTAEAGDYMACFFAADHSPVVTITVDFDWKSGVAAKDWSSVAKKGSVEIMELELKKMFDTVQSIHDEMFYLREREEEMQALNRSTNSRMGWLSVLSLVIALSVSGLQLWHLKSFFEKKKLI